MNSEVGEMVIGSHSRQEGNGIKKTHHGDGSSSPLSRD